MRLGTLATAVVATSVGYVIGWCDGEDRGRVVGRFQGNAETMRIMVERERRQAEARKDRKWWR
jgi:hypothetical protein